MSRFLNVTCAVIASKLFCFLKGKKSFSSSNPHGKMSEYFVHTDDSQSLQSSFSQYFPTCTISGVNVLGQPFGTRSEDRRTHRDIFPGEVRTEFIPEISPAVSACEICSPPSEKVNFVSTAFNKSSKITSTTQTGLVRNYVVYFGLFLLLLIALFIATPLVPR